jgi:hypothetical protein
VTVTFDEQEKLYRVLFEESDEEVGSEIYEIYDTLTEILANRSCLPQAVRILH